ncbi:MAG: PleD family two-component system response regulator [Alphaproteobacteria bacterium]
MSATVLIVDDLLPNIKLLEVKLTSEYYDVLSAKSGAEALKIIEEHTVDIILLDVMMPEMDGFEVCKRIKSNLKTSHIPIVMVTALSEIEDRVQGLNCGADDFLTKPINDMALFARIRSLVRIKIMLDELRLRDQTGIQFGTNTNNIINNIDDASIMIVDDDAVQAKHISTKLATMKNCQVVINSDINKALEEIINNNFDLVIVSTQLIDADGLRLCSHIRSHEKIRHLPLLILVEENDTNILIKGFDMGVNDYLLTPIEGNEVLARVNTQIKRKRYQDALKSNFQQSINMAITDSLTGLFNRRYFDAHCKSLIDQAKTLGKPLSLMIIDVDHFKSVNDTYGHLVGDEILKQLPNRITQNVRVTDLASRFGGEEFVVVMPNTSITDAQMVAERVRSSIENEVFTVSAPIGKLAKTVSIGVTLLNEIDTPETLLERADKGLYQAKQEGRNKVIMTS